MLPRVLRTIDSFARLIVCRRGRSLDIYDLSTDLCMLLKAKALFDAEAELTLLLSIDSLSFNRAARFQLDAFGDFSLD